MDAEPQLLQADRTEQVAGHIGRVTSRCGELFADKTLKHESENYSLSRGVTPVAQEEFERLRDSGGRIVVQRTRTAYNNNSYVKPSRETTEIIGLTRYPSGDAPFCHVIVSVYRDGAKTILYMLRDGERNKDGTDRIEEGHVTEYSNGLTQEERDVVVNAICPAS